MVFARKSGVMLDVWNWMVGLVLLYEARLKRAREVEHSLC